MNANEEIKRLEAARKQNVPWKKWGPYLSERQWGTVREDYSESGDAWNYFSHEQARSRAYRWGEDGIAGISDDKQRLCFAVALWNGKDPILKERMFGLTNSEGNHGEDVKEYYFYLDSTPTHSYMKYLYKYPQQEYPYHDLAAVNGQRNRNDFEYELLDTGIFNDNRYFDVYIEYAKESPEEILIKISAGQQGAGSRRTPCAAHALVPQHLGVLVRRHREAGLETGKQQHDRGRAPGARHVPSRAATGTRRSFLPRTRRTTSEYSAARTPRPMSRTGSTTMS